MTTYSDDQAIPIRLNNYEIAFGLTKREYFAALVMQGLAVQAIAGGHNTNDTSESKSKSAMAVRLADALIEELNKEST